MELFDRLHVRPGVTSVIGSGGKTSMLAHLAREAPGRVALATTTRIFPFAEFPLVTATDERAVCDARDASRIVCVGTAVEKGKIAEPAIAIERLAEVFDFVFVEADGSKQLPLKAHAPWEPVIPALSNCTILMVGAPGFGRTVSEAAHRPELFAERASCQAFDEATPERVARVIEHERQLGLIAPNFVMVNAAGMQPGEDAIAELKRHIDDVPVISCSLPRPLQQPL